MLEILAIIPARGGSKGIPHKNMADLCGHPLLYYTFEAAKSSKLITRSILSTDDEGFASYAESQGIEAVMRPESLATDTTPMKDVIDYHLETLKKSGFSPDIFILLQPTSPLRKASHIDEALQAMIEDSQADATVSVTPVPHSCLPMKIMEMNDDGFLDFYIKGGEKYTTRQGLPTLYARNGAAIYAVYTEKYLKSGKIYGDHCKPYIMGPEVSIDIDTPFDLKMAELLMKSEFKNEL